MRKIRFKRYVPAIWTDANGVEFAAGQRPGNAKLKEGTGRWEPNHINEGIFHRWAEDLEERDNGMFQQTLALIELTNGTMEMVIPNKIKFDIPIALVIQ